MKVATWIVLLAAPLLGSASPDAPPYVPAQDFAVKDRITPVDPLAERPTSWAHPSVTMTDVVYTTLPGYRPLHLDLYRPKSGAGFRPLVVYIHGGGWAQANPRVGAAFADFPAVLASLVERGYVVASISHRMSGEAAFPAQLDDLRAALDFLRSNASRFGIDPARVGLWGMSSGAHLAALAVLDCKAGNCAQVLVGWFGPYDLAVQAREERSGSVRALLRCGEGGCEAGSLQQASPVSFVDGHDPPVLLVHGATDTAVAPSQSEGMAAALREAGVDVELLLIDRAGHGLVGPSPADTRRALRQGLEATWAFLDAHLLAQAR